MGKHKRDKISKAVRANPISRNNLEDQMASDRVVGAEESKTKGSKSKYKNKESMEDPEFMDEKTTQRILKAARKQQQDIDTEQRTSSDKPSKSRTVSLGTENSELSDDDDDFLLPVESREDTEALDMTIDPEEERALELFMKKDAEPMKNLGNIIMEKFTEKKTELESQFSDAGITMHELHPKVQLMYEGVRDCLKVYRSGQLPKSFKIIPKLVNWEQILHITEPTSWTAAAMYQATRIFASNLKEKMAQRFFNLVLLPRIRDDVAQYKKLNFHLYQALRKALFKPAAFMRGILIPLCESGTCTLREAVIIGSVLAKNSIPILHSSAAMLMIAEMDYSGSNSIFLKILLDKKYALPYRVIDAVVYHFLKFEQDKRELPVLWHQSFVTFIQRYKNYLSSEQKESLQGLLRAHTHYQITPEIRRELLNSITREEMIAAEAANPPSGPKKMDQDGDDDDDDDMSME